MLIDSNNLLKIVRLDLENIATKYPTIYSWIMSNSKKIGMHPTKLRRELIKCLNSRYRVIDLTDRRTRLIRCRISH